MALADFVEKLDSFRKEVRSFDVSLDVGGQPPTIGEVMEALLLVESDLHHAWIRTLVVRYLVAPKVDRPGWVERYVNGLDSDLEGTLRHHYDPDGLNLILEDDSLPVARVLSSEHSNPLRTTIAVTAFSSVMVVLSVTWAVRDYFHAQGDLELKSSQATLLKAVATALITPGAPVTPGNLQAVMPLAEAIIKGAQQQNNSFDVRITPSGADLKVSQQVGSPPAPRSPSPALPPDPPGVTSAMGVDTLARPDNQKP